MPTTSKTTKCVIICKIKSHVLYPVTNEILCYLAFIRLSNIGTQMHEFTSPNNKRLCNFIVHVNIKIIELSIIKTKSIF